MTNKNFEMLEDLVDRLGQREAVDLLVFSWPVLAERECGLREALLSGDWPVAARLAHKTLGSVRLYGTQRLEQLLATVLNIQETQPADVAALQCELSMEMEAAIGMILEWLLGQGVELDSQYFAPSVADGLSKQPDRYCSFY